VTIVPERTALAAALLLLRGVWDRLSLYVPMLLMAVLALSTYWLVRSTPDFAPVELAKPPSFEPDYVMSGFAVKTFDTTGRLKSEVSGAQARHFPHSDQLEISSVRIRSFNARGQLTVASADRALTDSDGREVELLGNATVVREAVGGPHPAPRLSFSGEHLHANTLTEKIRSDKPVRLTRGADQFQADTLALDNLAQVVELRGRVRGTIAPAAPGAP
jgi:lipopolysaccharide export system protein LptC